MAKKKSKTIVHVNQLVIRSNQKTGDREPTLSIKRGKRTTRAHEVYIDGPSRVIYSPDKPLSCGARVWIETEAPVAEIVHTGPSLLGGRGPVPCGKAKKCSAGTNSRSARKGVRSRAGSSGLPSI